MIRSGLRCFFHDDDRGAVAVEFVLIAPLLLSLLYGTICFGYLFGVSHAVNQLAAETARVSVRGTTQCPDDPALREMIALDYFHRAATRFPLLRVEALQEPDIDVSEGCFSDVEVTVRYDLDGSVVEIANTLFGLELTTIEGRAFLAY